VTNIFKERFEVGVGLLGGYCKYLIVKPKDYTKLSISNVALSTIGTAHFLYWKISEYDPPPENLEAFFGVGMLIGVPLFNKCSISTGILACISKDMASDFYSDSNDKNDSNGIFREKFTADRIKIFIPINLLLKFHIYEINMFGYLNGNIPFEITERYHLSLFYNRNQDREIKSSPSFDNMTNYELRLGVGLFYGSLFSK
jgi:hypothetical protein